MMKRSRILILLVGLVIPASATTAAATAATVRVQPVSYKPVHTGDEVIYQAGPGERNDVVMTWMAPLS